MSCVKPKIKSSPELDIIITDLYASGKNAKQVAEKCDCSSSFIRKTLKRLNISIRPSHIYPNKRSTKYISNEKFFDTIDTEEKAYTFGFFYADGNNYTGNGKKLTYEISISLQEQDKYILEKFRDFLSPNSILRFIDKKKDNINWNNQYKLIIHNKIISQQLTNLGCVPAKSLILTFPKWLVDPNLQRHFIRGYFDGDGTLCARKPKITGHIAWEWGIISSDSFCENIKQYIELATKVNVSKRLANPKLNQITTNISVSGNLQIRKVLDWIYKDATIYLPRKYDKYLKFLKEQKLLGR